MRKDVVIEALVVGLHLRWEGVWQRPNHILTRLAARVPVIVVEEPRSGPSARDRIRAVDGLTVIVPERRTSADAVDDMMLVTVRRLLGGRRSLVWLYSPLMLGLGDVAPGAPLIYDKMDELAAFRGADARIARREDELVRRAALVFAGGHSLWQSVRGRVRAGAAFPSGVDCEHYEKAPSGRLLPELAALTGPVLGYVGVIDERLDLGLIAHLARVRPDATVVLVGPLAKIEAAALPQAANILYLGKRGYDELPGIVRRFDVALMPFALTESTRYISPTKTLEYLAAGRPVVSTPVADVVADFSDVVLIAAGAEKFAAAVRQAERFDARRYGRGLLRARAQSWDAVVAGMLARMSEAGLEFAPSSVSRAVGAVGA